MIDLLRGTLLEKGPGEVVLLCGGVGYLVTMPAPDIAALPATGQEATVHTVLHLAENDVSLYGFSGKEGKVLFRSLTSVSGVGPRVGIAILNALRPDRIVLAVGAGDHKALTAASGVGPKLAQRIILELKDKVAKGLGEGLSAGDVGAVDAGALADAPQKALAALIGLGYTPSEAAVAVNSVDATLPVSEIIRLALQKFSQKK